MGSTPLVEVELLFGDHVFAEEGGNDSSWRVYPVRIGVTELSCYAVGVPWGSRTYLWIVGCSPTVYILRPQFKNGLLKIVPVNSWTSN